MKEKQAVTSQVRSRYQKAGRKEKSAILDEFIKITGYKNRKYALRILNKPQAHQALLVVKGKAIKLKPQKKRPANRTGKKIYTDEVVASLRLIWSFFWYKCGRTEGSQILAPFMRQQMDALSLKGKSLTKPGLFLKNRIPIRTFYSSVERKLPGFIQIDTGGL